MNFHKIVYNAQRILDKSVVTKTSCRAGNMEKTICNNDKIFNIVNFKYFKRKMAKRNSKRKLQKQ